jgi:hypothetical protein
MDPWRSPYAPGVGTRPVTLAGRDQILERFDITLSRLETGRPGVAPLITGSRGSGKTVLLNELINRARERGWFVGSEEVIPETPLSTLIAILAHEVLLEMSKRHRVAANVGRVLGILKAFTAVSALGVTLNINVDAVTGTADTGIFSRDLRRLFIEIGELAKQQSVGVIFALDEVHRLDEDELSDLNSALHQTAQRQLPVTFVGAGLFPSWQKSGLEEPDPTRIDSYDARLSTSTYMRLMPLDSTASRQALAGPALVEQVTFTEEALDAAIAFCQGNAWILQLLGAAAWEAAERSPIHLDDIKEAKSQVTQQLDQWFFPKLVRNCSGEEIRVLTFIASRLDTDVAEFESTEMVDRILGVNSRRILSMLAWRDLIELESRHMQILDGERFSARFSMPMLGNYFRRDDIDITSTINVTSDKRPSRVNRRPRVVDSSSLISDKSGGDVPRREQLPLGAEPPDENDLGVAERRSAPVEGLYCKNGHFNNPATRWCSECGISMARATKDPPLHHTDLSKTDAYRVWFGDS